MNNITRFIEELRNPFLIIEARKDAIRFEKEGTIIDTCFCHDTQKWETAICKDLNQKKGELEHWAIVDSRIAHRIRCNMNAHLLHLQKRKI
jgi:hypothetical protein